MGQQQQHHHATDMDIVRYLDGELSWWRARSVRRHVEACWQCRAQADEIRQLTGDFVRYRERFLFPRVPPPPGPWRDLRSEMAEPFTPPLAPRLAWRPLGVALAAISLGAAVYYHEAMSIAKPTRQPEQQPVALPHLPTSTAPRAALPARQPETPPERRNDADRQVQILAGLHRAGADLGEPVELRTRDGQWEVAVLGLPETRVAEIRAALPPGTALSVSALPPVTMPPPRASAPPAAIAAPARELVAKLGGAAAFELLANRLLEESDALLARAFALRNLNRQLPAQLSAASLAAAESIRADHRRAYAAHAARLIELSVPLRDAVSSPPLRRAGAAGDPVEGGQRVDRILNAYLAGAAAPLPPAQWPLELAAALGALLP